jgi:hypothetical protein
MFVAAVGVFTNNYEAFSGTLLNIVVSLTCTANLYGA